MLVETCGYGFGFFVDVSLGGFEIASNEFERDFEERSVEDELVVCYKFRRVPYHVESLFEKQLLLRASRAIDSHSHRPVSKFKVLL
jgi:hypothetical protein